jgi:DNA polymerase III beta subunit, C-terminal domain
MRSSKSSKNSVMQAPKRFLVRDADHVIKNVQEIIKVVLPTSWVELLAIAPKVWRKDPKKSSKLEICRAIWNYTKKNFKYAEDPIGIELIRYPSQSFEDADTGIDCEDLSILNAGLTNYFGIKSYFKIVKWKPDPYNPASSSKEWRHIYLIVKDGKDEIILDSTADKFNDHSFDIHIMEERLFEIPLFKMGKGKGLGALPKDLWSEREKFIINLWQQMVRDGVTYESSKYDGYTNSLPNGVTVLTFGEYVKRYFPAFEVEFKAKEKKVTVNNRDVVLEERYFIKGNNFGITLMPTKVSNNVFLIDGEKGVAFKPDRKAVGKHEISPYNDALMAFMKPFISKDPLRPAMTGVCFDENGAVATDGHRLMLIQYKNNQEAQNEKGIYVPKTLQVIDEIYPDYPPAIPQKQSYFAEINTEELINGLKLMNTYANKTTHRVKIIITADKAIISAEDLDYSNEAIYPIKCRSNAIQRAFGVNAKFFLELLAFLKKMKVETTKIYFSEPSKAITTYIDTDFGKAILLQMPMLLTDYNEDETGLENNENVEGFSKYKDIFPPDWSKKLVVSNANLQEKARQLRENFKSEITLALMDKI